jgi:hypothetical protein
MERFELNLHNNNDELGAPGRALFPISRPIQARSACLTLRLQPTRGHGDNDYHNDVRIIASNYIPRVRGELKRHSAIRLSCQHCAASNWHYLSPRRPITRLRASHILITGLPSGAPSDPNSNIGVAGSNRITRGTDACSVQAGVLP